MREPIDYRKFYDDEAYLLEVGSAFRVSGELDPVDL
jgi:hypothetical protein